MSSAEGKGFPAVAMYGPCNIKDTLRPNETKLWCSCGLSKKQPWCDGSHKGTGFTPVKWTVPSPVQSLYQLCACKYTKSPPYCDATHVYLPLEVCKRQKECQKDHTKKLCTACGSAPDCTSSITQTRMDGDKRKLTPFQYSLAGGVSGAVTRTVGQPLDVLKIRFQIRSAKLSHYQPQGLFHTAKRILNNEGVPAFWKGHVPAQVLSILFGSVMFTSYETLKSHTSKYLTKDCIARNQSALDFMWGGLAGISATTVCQPFDVLRTRLVAQDGNVKVYRGVAHAMKTIFKENGFTAFYRGLRPTVLAIFPYNGIHFALYGFLKRSWRLIVHTEEDTQLMRMSCGAASGLGSKLLTLPFDIVKKHLQVQGFHGYTNEYRGMMHCCQTVVRKDGVRGLFRGGLPSVLKAVVVVSVSFTAYEQMCDWMRNLS